MISKANAQSKSKQGKNKTCLPQIAQAVDADLAGRATPKKDKDVATPKKDRDIIELQLNAAVSQLDKFRNILREKDLMLQSLKQENLILKQVWVY